MRCDLTKIYNVELQSKTLALFTLGHAFNVLTPYLRIPKKKKKNPQKIWCDGKSFFKF